jgi:hypothetical protein
LSQPSFPPFSLVRSDNRAGSRRNRFALPTTDLAASLVNEGFPLRAKRQFLPDRFCRPAETVPLMPAVHFNQITVLHGIL